jgi:ADP-ribose pyrophosphatase YjhB (NUDIX family)
MNSPKNNCLNCGKNGHIFKFCSEPIISYGLVCFNINNMLNITSDIIENYLHNKFVDIENFNLTNLNNISMIPHYYNMIKILLVRRKHSLNYIEFIRGKYEIDKLQKMFTLMTRAEIENIKTVSFDILWNNLWNETSYHKVYMKEYNLSKNKFTALKNNNFYNMLECDSFEEAEWGFPKGRRNMNETNITCAVREFSEETRINIDNFNVLEKINCISEDIMGTNMKKYRHIYYMANMDTEIHISPESVQSNEIGDIGWFTIPEAIEKIRPYYNDKIKMIHQIYFFIINLIADINKNNKTITL